MHIHALNKQCYFSRPTVLARINEMFNDWSSAEVIVITLTTTLHCFLILALTKILAL
jgi:hypothetical protein